MKTSLHSSRYVDKFFSPGSGYNIVKEKVIIVKFSCFVIITCINKVPYKFTLCAIVLATSGPIIPGIVAAKFVMPIRTPEY